ncbi:putative C6 finger domain protein [Sporothrix schenckii 1099-18]|uniref:Putative C6 finger domain protein n=1 Tax=Sporothrix schenckii 1099-18 TaxID=1397361 RepID=A0A0F2MFJ5_SPOSC|nr:putative C6 finger domain protein [Sporothrix schenckii 1099-18]KJR87615.1 putative C6 finger domain protein [Sporothrix schenckii 1099-18]
MDETTPSHSSAPADSSSHAKSMVALGPTILPGENERTSNLRHKNGVSGPNKRHYRVRTGCLVCRTRKVKCGEQRPSCDNCIKSRRTCIYKPPAARKWLSRSTTVNNQRDTDHPQDLNGTGSEPLVPAPDTEQEEESPAHGQHSLIRNPFDFLSPSETIIPGEAMQSHDLQNPGELQSDVQPAVVPSPVHQPDIWTSIQPHMQQNNSVSGSVETCATDYQGVYDSCLGSRDLADSPTDSLSSLHGKTSHLICLTVDVDKAAATARPTESSFSYFIEEVDCPFVSPFDTMNWATIKTHIAELGKREVLVGMSIDAVESLYRALTHRLPTTYAMSTYNTVLVIFPSACGNNQVDFDVILIIAFLLCLFKLTLPNEDGPTVSILRGDFTTRLEAWLLEDHQSSISLRIGTWLQFLDTASKRGGCKQLLPEPIFDLLSDNVIVPNIPALDKMSPEDALYVSVSAPVFEFYSKLQGISNRVADVTHYHRSRFTPTDQAEAAEILSGLTADLHSLWDVRPSLLRLQSADITRNFSSRIAQPLVACIGVCLASYFVEFVVIGRILGDPLFASPKAKQAMDDIRDIVDGGWNVLNKKEGLNPGYLRPLFYYGVESFDEEKTTWAADRLRQINNPISRGAFFASFVKLHGEAQRSQKRRVTLKYFCYQNYHIPPPFM